jgi:hypothetical protein
VQDGYPSDDRDGAESSSSSDSESESSSQDEDNEDSRAWNKELQHLLDLYLTTGTPNRLQTKTGRESGERRAPLAGGWAE